MSEKSFLFVFFSLRSIRYCVLVVNYLHLICDDNVFIVSIDSCYYWLYLFFCLYPLPPLHYHPPLPTHFLQTHLLHLLLLYLLRFPPLLLLLLLLFYYYPSHSSYSRMDNRDGRDFNPSWKKQVRLED